MFKRILLDLCTPSSNSGKSRFIRIPYKNAANLDGDWNSGSGGRSKKSTVSVSHNQSCCPIVMQGGSTFSTGMCIHGCPRKLVNV